MRTCVVAAAVWLFACTGSGPAVFEAPETLVDLGAVRPGEGEGDLAAGPADLAADLATDLAADLAAAAGPEECALPLMSALYPGGLPPNPYGPLPMADACVQRRHDAIIVLGCPNQASGAPAACQTRRVELAVALAKAGLGDRFIPSGAAVHNSYVEAETLRALLLGKGVPAAQIFVEDKARHTDENLYYSSQIMSAHGWRSALVVSEDPGHLILTAVCDSNCCVELGRLTVLGFPLQLPGEAAPTRRAIGHYALYPAASPATSVTPAECTFIKAPLKLMCTNLMTRNACLGRVMLP